MMNFSRLFDRIFQRGVRHIPTLYANRTPLQLEQFLTNDEYQGIKKFDNVFVLPFVSRQSERSQMCFGFGLSRLMIRNLMLLRDISIHGPEDTPEIPYEAIDRLFEVSRASSYVTGVAHYEPNDYSVSLEYHHPGQPVTTAQVKHENFEAFLRECSWMIACLLRSKVDENLKRAWTVAQPRNVDTLVELGRIHVDFTRDQPVERGQVVKNILAADPTFAVALWDFDNELPDARQKYIEGLKRDPFNAQLHFETFIAIWKSKGPQPEALQFCRRAIELSPGHGKAHMCAPHAAHRPLEMLRHSELGYRLLPGNSFAINNYTLALTRANAPAVQRIELAEEGIAADPRDPGSYERLIELCMTLGDFRTALATAERLQKLYSPKMDERALYCLRQNPERARLIDSRAYDPVSENSQRITELRKRI